ncbi:MAG: hypothetical protein MK110_02875 [Fuerstiella sp.]|nr:hypothetical protein [Fuerstiella sp.]
MIPRFVSNHPLTGMVRWTPGHHIQVLLRLTVLTGMLSCLSGCNYLIFFGYLLGGPPQLEPAFEKATNKSFTDRGVRVAVVCYAPDELRYQYDSVDHLIAVGVSARLKQNHVAVVNSEAVRVWLEENPDWDTPDEVGAQFDTTFVVYIDLSDFSLYEHDSRHLFRGRAEATVSVYEMQADGEGQRIFHHELMSEFPRLTPRSASEISYDSFRSEYLLRISDEIGRMFYPYGSGDDVGSGT